MLSENVKIRPLFPGDGPAVRAMLGRCSNETIYRRFLAPIPMIRNEWLRRLLAPPSGEVIVAVSGSDIIGIGHLVPVGATTEIALLVEDAWQHCGVGRALTEHMAELAGVRGIATLSGVVLRDNDPVIKLLTSAFPTVRFKREGAECTFEIALAPALSRAG